MKFDFNSCLGLLIIVLVINSSCEEKDGQNTAAESIVHRFEETKIENIKAMEAAKILKENPDMMILDIRTPEEFNSGHIPASINIDYKAKNFESELKKLDPSKPFRTGDIPQA